jgi:hypothetical protein
VSVYVSVGLDGSLGFAENGRESREKTSPERRMGKVGANLEASKFSASEFIGIVEGVARVRG